MTANHRYVGSSERCRVCNYTRNHVIHRTLSDMMEFDHVIEVRHDGAIVDRADVWAPELHDGELCTSADWNLLDGFSGQYRYSGPMMHQSEFIGGYMERYIRENPGLYVSLVSHPACDEDCEFCDGDGCEPTEWAVAYIMADDPDAEVPGIEHHLTGVSFCPRCRYRLILMSDDDGEGGIVTDTHTFADCDANIERGVS